MDFKISGEIFYQLMWQKHYESWRDRSGGIPLHIYNDKNQKAAMNSLVCLQLTTTEGQADSMSRWSLKTFCWQGSWKYLRFNFGYTENSCRKSNKTDNIWKINEVRTRRDRPILDMKGLHSIECRMYTRGTCMSKTKSVYYAKGVTERHERNNDFTNVK